MFVQYCCVVKKKRAGGRGPSINHFRQKKRNVAQVKTCIHSSLPRLRAPVPPWHRLGVHRHGLSLHSQRWPHGECPPPPRGDVPPALPPPPRPDHFVALRVPLDVAAPLFGAAHAALTAADGGASKHCIEAASAHVTLAVLRLAPDDSTSREPCPDAVQRARAALAAAGGAIGGPLPFAVLPDLRSLAGGRVAYLPAAGDALPGAAAAVEAALTSHGLGRHAHVTQAWTPHVTVAKLAWSGARPPRRGLPVAKAAVAAPFDGLPPPSLIQAAELVLCPIGGQRAVGEFYRVVHSVGL